MNNQFWLWTWISVWFTGATVNDTINNIDNWQQETKKKYDEQKTLELENKGRTMFECAMRTPDGQVRKQNLSGANLSNMEVIIKQAAKEHWSSAYDDLWDWQILCKFMYDNPQYEKISNGALWWDVNLKTWARYIWADTSIPNTSVWNWEKKWWFFNNVWWAVIDALVKEPMEAWIKGTAWLMDKFWADNVEARKQANLKMVNDWFDVWQDREDSLTYDIANFWTDLVQLLIPWLWEKAAMSTITKLSTKYPKIGKYLMKLWTEWEKLTNKGKILKWWLEWTVDSAVYEWLNAENPTSSMWEWAALWALFPTLWVWYDVSKKAWWKLISKAIDKEILPSAWKAIQSMNKLTKWKSIEFQKKFWKPHWDWLNERWIVEWAWDTVEQLADYTAKNKAKVDEWLASIKWIIESSKTNEVLHEMADDVARYVEEVSVTPSEIRKYKTLAEKAKTEWLTMEEINDVKRYYESHNKFAYWMDKTAAAKTERATNIDNAVRERQIEEAAKRWFTNLRELNKETSASKWLTNELWAELKWTYWNDSFTLSDYLVVWNLSPENIALLWWKKILNAEWFKKKYVDVINKIKKHENIEEKLVDLETISKINNEKDLEKWLASDYNTPKLWYKQDVEWKDFVEHIIADDKWNNARINNWIVLDRN